MKITGRLVWVGREHKNDPEQSLCQRYLERINHYGKFDQIAVKPIPGQSPEMTREKEARKCLQHLRERDFVFLCDERGQSLSSKAFAGQMQTQGSGGNRRLVWIVGGSMGVAQELRQRADFVLSLSKMTLPHGLARAVLLEQIYRGLSILAGHPYHHEG